MGHQLNLRTSRTGTIHGTTVVMVYKFDNKVFYIRDDVVVQDALLSIARLAPTAVDKLQTLVLLLPAALILGYCPDDTAVPASWSLGIVIQERCSISRCKKQENLIFSR
ncbi:hypothetical protein AVEN_49003-1 [Araneus ventricosus]|uniref:Uncharacterized protein n=1 Tax=Araneus ventricosus TaxID=182803 RepID=A0A4Y2AGY0_ARAVE|nr:hypothetical protein AVEN_49003-1 [Araneus ventricosus]